MNKVHWESKGRGRYSLIYVRVEHLRTNKKDKIIDTDEEENLVATSIKRPIVIAVELRSPLARFPLALHIEAQNAVGHMGGYIRSER